MGFLSDIVGGITGSTAAKASKKAGRIQQEEAERQAGNIGVAGQQAFDILGGAGEGLGVAGQEAISRFDPLAGVGQQGIDLAGFLGDPSQQASFLESNPLFQLGLQNLNEQTQKSAASRGRLTAGDTLQQLQQNAQLAGQPLIDRQRQDIMNLLGINQNVAGQQANIGLGTAGQQANIAGQQAGVRQNTAQDVANLFTGGAAANAAGVVGAANARSGTLGNILNLGATPLNAFAPAGSLFGGAVDLFGGN